MSREQIKQSYTEYETVDNPIKLDDHTSGSRAVYTMDNPNYSQFYYYLPEEQHLQEPRCDYLLVNANSTVLRFIELKGNDGEKDNAKCCNGRWEHGFHQLCCTYDHFKSYIPEK